MSDDQNPLIQSLPPNSDYLTYLTIVEYNLTPENLPVLHEVLQDETLTTNIGWDLVHLLVPYLPDSEQCLQDVARLGNPREVILKVTESLRLIEYENAEEDASSDIAEPAVEDVRDRVESSTYPIKTAATAEGRSAPGSSQMMETPPPVPLAISQFVALLSMLSTLHSRIRTQHPSRFLSTTLQAILASFSNSVTHRDEMVLAIVQVVKSIRGIKRPALPSRKSSGMIASKSTKHATSAADPEATAGIQPSSDDVAMQTRLFHSFITHVMEEYLLNLPEHEDVPGMAWCSRILEKTMPKRIIPDSKTFTSRFTNEDQLHARIEATGQLLALAQDLKLTNETLLVAANTQEKVSSIGHGEDEPPVSADDIPLSRLGSLFLYTARQASSILYGGATSTINPSFTIFPNHQDLLQHCLASSEHGTGSLGTEPASLIDAVLAIGIICLDRDSIGAPASDEQFNEYLQVTALLSSNCPNPNMRSHAHYLTSTILRSQPDDNVRLEFIRDTLEHCPFENLKVSAVGWIKGETVEANPPTPIPGDHRPHMDSETSPTSIFATPLALDSLASHLFPSLRSELITVPVNDAWLTFQTNLSFYLASLNFIYLLLSARHLHQSLEIRELWNNADIAGSFLGPLREAGVRFAAELNSGALIDEKSDAVAADLNLLDATIMKVTSAVSNLND